MSELRPTRFDSHLLAAWALAALVAAFSAGILVAAKADDPDPASVAAALKLRRPPVPPAFAP